MDEPWCVFWELALKINVNSILEFMLVQDEHEK